MLRHGGRRQREDDALTFHVRALVPQKFSVEEELMHVKHVDFKSPHVGVMWKFGRGVISSESLAVQEKGGNRLVPGMDYMMDVLKLPNQAPTVSGESLQTCVAWRCPDGIQYFFCWPILAVSSQ
ncbi:hypothetical protein TNCV_891401 [Trichonephila clavipes]|nr:hypothetical protein TNCV_891401 [Trichonephila clavipes]